MACLTTASAFSTGALSAAFLAKLTMFVMFPVTAPCHTREDSKCLSAQMLRSHNLLYGPWTRPGGYVLGCASQLNASACNYTDLWRQGWLGGGLYAIEKLLP